MLRFFSSYAPKVPPSFVKTSLLYASVKAQLCVSVCTHFWFCFTDTSLSPCQPHVVLTTRAPENPECLVSFDPWPRTLSGSFAFHENLEEPPPALPS